MTGDPARSDCIRSGCGHSSDVHVFAGSGLILARLTVTESASAWPCEECECPTMIRSWVNYAAITGQDSGDHE